MKLTYAVSNGTDQTFPYEKVDLVISVQATYTEALFVLDAAREAAERPDPVLEYLKNLR